jgi:aspartyl protease family protein
MMRHESGVGTTMRNLLIFGILAVSIAGAATRFVETSGGSPDARAGAASAVSPDTRASTDPRTMVVQRDQRGHFRVSGAVEGRQLDFLVDTGASGVVLREREAVRLGLRLSERDFRAPVKTANGSIRAAPVTLKRVEIGWISLANVDALVLPDAALGENLLGLSFLSRLRRFEFAQNRLVLEQ